MARGVKVNPPMRACETCGRLRVVVAVLDGGRLVLGCGHDHPGFTRVTASLRRTWRSRYLPERGR